MPRSKAPLSHAFLAICFSAFGCCAMMMMSLLEIIFARDDIRRGCSRHDIRRWGQMAGGFIEGFFGEAVSASRVRRSVAHTP